MIGINGIAGRIGKFSLYEALQEGLSVVAGNDLTSTDGIVSALSQKDSTHGDLGWHVQKVSEDYIAIDGQNIRIHHERDPANIDWGASVRGVIEATGFFTSKEDAMRHYKSVTSALETVLISAPGKGDMKTLVMGVNHTDYEFGDHVVSNASCTTKALSLPMKVLEDAGVGVYDLQMVTAHAATNSDKPLDNLDYRGVLDNIISAKTGAASATGLVIPSLEGKMDGFALRVPTKDGSFAYCTALVEGQRIDAGGLNDLFYSAVSDDRYSGRIGVHDGAEISSADIIGRTESSVIVPSKTRSRILPFSGRYHDSNQVAHISFLSGYDNERGPTKDIVLLAKYALRG